MRYVIIGNSAAGIGCVEGIRQVDREGSITIISSESHHTYSRPLISYLLQGKTDREKIKYRPDTFYETNNCQLMFGRVVTEIDPKSQKVTLDDGSTVEYDKLLVATGSRPFVPPFAGLDTVPVKHTFMSLDDATGLENSLSPDSRVFIIGAGLIGLKCAEGILGRIASLTITDLAPSILPSILDTQGAEMVQKHLESQGIQFLLNNSVDHFSGNTAVMKTGEHIEFDVLVIAVGVRPNTDLISKAGGNVNRGIVIDETCKTSLDNVYAAGDCCESYDISKGESRILALLPNAYLQGECAGIAMADGKASFNNAIPMNAIGFFGLHIITAGSYLGEVYRSVTDNNYKELFCQDGLLKGYILIGDVSRAGIYTRLIREQIPLDTIDFDLIKEKPQLMAFARTERDQMLGGQQ